VLSEVPLVCVVPVPLCRKVTLPLSAKRIRLTHVDTLFEAMAVA